MDNKYSISFITFDSHQPPVIFEQKNKDLIIFGNEDGYWNQYPKYLLDNYNKSSIHNAICNGKINYIVGSGLKIASFGSVESKALAMATLKSVNEYEDADDLNRKIIADTVVFGGFYVELIQAIDGVGIHSYHLSFDYIRKCKKENEDDPQLWHYTKDWSKPRYQQNEDYKVFQSFEGKFEKGVNYLVDYSLFRVGNLPYALPDYLAANAYIELDWRIANFLLNNVKNGFSAGFLVNFYNGLPTDEQKKEIENSIKKKFAGDSNGGGFVLNFNDQGTTPAEIIPIPTNGHDERFNTLKEAVRDNLFTSHNIVNPMLFGVRESGSLGGREELIDSFDLMQATYISNRQNFIEKFWNDFLGWKKIDAKYSIIPASIFGESEKVNEVALALGNLSPLVATKILDTMTPSEVRALIGLEGGVVNVQPVQTQLSDEEIESKILTFFGDCGFDDEQLIELKSEEIQAVSISDAKSKSLKFAADISAIEKQVIGLLLGNPKMPVAEIAAAIGETPKATMDIVDSLRIKGLVDFDKDGNPELTEEGSKVDVEQVFIVYKYALRMDAPSLEGGESRPFCRQMIARNKSYKMSDIERLNNGMNLDVFTFRGGFYTNPNTGRTTPYCRHTWVQRLVKLKK